MLATDHTSSSCLHCGANVNQAISGEADFCCTGCSTVYALLHDKGLDNFYQLNKNPGTKVQQQKFAFLENEELADELLSFKNDSIGRVRLTLPGIHCSSCVWLLEELPHIDIGIQRAQVNFSKKSLDITFDHRKTSLLLIVELVNSLGYELSFDRTGEKESKNQWSLIIRIGVAGFCMGNIMLLALPEYLSLAELAEDYANFSPGLKSFFSWLSLGLSLPVLFYCASSYWKSGIAGIRHGKISIDVPIVLGMSMLFLVSLVDVVMGNGVGYLDSLAGLVFLLLIGKWFQERTYSALNFDREFDHYFPLGVLRVVEGKESYVKIDQLEVGDQIVVNDGEVIPCDVELVSRACMVDFSFVTGESDLVRSKKGDSVYAGGRVSGVAARFVVSRKVNASYISQLWTTESKPTRATIESRIDMVSRYFTIGLLSLCAIAAIIWAFVAPEAIVSVVASILIIACPCALSLSIPFSYGSATVWFQKWQFFVQSPGVVEMIDRVDTVVFDKTGTLTEDCDDVKFEGETLNQLEWQQVLGLANQSSHPYSRAIRQRFSNEEIITPDELSVTDGKGISGVFGEMEIKLGSAIFVNEMITESNGAVVYLSINGETRGVFHIQSKYRAGLESLPNQLPGKELYVLSGDNDAERGRLSEIFKDSNLHFNMKPTNKMEFITQLQEAGKCVMMVGDGLNDAGALKKADVGISITGDEYRFAPASNGILVGNRLVEMGKMFAFSSATKNVLNRGLVFSLSYNVIGLSFALTNHLNPLISAILMPISAISIMLFSWFSVKYAANQVFGSVD